MAEDRDANELGPLLDELEAAAITSPAALEALRTHPQLADAGGDLAVRAARLLLEQGMPSDLQTAAELAFQAHQDGVAGAGHLFAASVDRACMMSSRTQRFGTFAYEHRGEHLLAPVDGSVDDELRASLGISPLASLQAQLDAANREIAARRATQEGLERGQTYARVWRNPTEADLRARWEREGQPIWADGDELTVVTDRDLPGAIVGPLFELPMWRVGELLVLTVRVHRLDEAVFTYGIWPLDEDGRPAFTVRPDPDGRFRGVNARPAAPTREELTGTLSEHQVDSGALGRPRTVTVYRPADHDPSERLPVVYATDGQFFPPYARRLDPAMESGATPRCVVVASHAGRNRTGEYFPGYDPAAFSRHEHFFLDELPAWAEATFGVATERDRRAVFGCSDGGAHAVFHAANNPDRFAHAIAYSSGLPPNGVERWSEGTAPFIQLCAGIYEGQFHTSTYAWHAYLSMTGVEHHWVERVCGHEPLQWIEELPDALARAFGPS